ncbi:hypothetical protein Tco_1362405 [Tanacetum coccineum]
MLTKPQFFYDHTTKQALGFQNPFYLKKAQQLEPKIYDGNFIKNTSAIVIPDSEETLMLAEESRSKMVLKQKDPMILEKKVNTTLVDYANYVNSQILLFLVDPPKLGSKELPKVSMVLRVGEIKHPSLLLNPKSKDTVIKKLKERIKSLSRKLNEDKIKKDLEEIETINIELDHRVSVRIRISPRYNSEESLRQGFAAALVVLITGASQSRQHGMSEPARRSLTD